MLALTRPPELSVDLWWALIREMQASRQLLATTGAVIAARGDVLSITHVRGHLASERAVAEVAYEFLRHALEGVTSPPLVWLSALPSTPS